MKLEQYQHVQAIAKKVLNEIPDFINNESTEQSIALKAKQLLIENGITDTWYYDTPAFVLLGSRSCLSISGKNYKPTCEKVGSFNLVTIDLSPSLNNIWGDCARSFCIENGKVTDRPTNTEFVNGLNTQNTLHSAMINFVKPTTTFSELFHFGNQLITQSNFKNLDFLGNLGHSIETNKNDRKYIDKECHAQLSEVNYFTFEPHIKSKDGNWGFKQENIYYFDKNGKLKEL